MNPIKTALAQLDAAAAAKEEADEQDPRVIAGAIANYIEKAAAQGKKVGYAEAAAAVSAKK